jgi:hypothetical protein
MYSPQPAPQAAPQRAFLNELMITGWQDIPNAEKFGIVCTSASFLLMAFSTPVGGTLLALTAWGYYKAKSEQDKLVKKYYGLMGPSGFWSSSVNNESELEAIYKEVGGKENNSLHNACVLRLS